MIGFIISTIAFSFAAYALNRYFDAHKSESTPSRKFHVMIIATGVSIGTGWLVDKLDGDAESPQNKISIIDTVQSGDPLKIAKLIIGIN
jgi:hypothetical protein